MRGRERGQKRAREKGPWIAACSLVRALYVRRPSLSILTADVHIVSDRSMTRTALADSQWHRCRRDSFLDFVTSSNERRYS